MGDIDFIIETLEADEIRKLYERSWYREAIFSGKRCSIICSDRRRKHKRKGIGKGVSQKERYPLSIW